MYNFIVNTASRSGNGLYVWNAVETKLKEEQVEYKAHFTKYRFHATKIAKKLTGTGSPVTLIGVGGDGTVNEIINGIVDFEQTTFGYIPTGSGNDFAKGLPIPGKPLEALDCILHPRYIRSMDIGDVLYNGKSKSFAVSMGIGFDASICFESNTSPIKNILNKVKLGKLTYVGVALKQLLLLNTSKITLTLDDSKVYQFDKCYFITIMNQKYEGGGFAFCPEAENNDDYLDICVVDSIPKAKIAVVFPSAFKGNHVKIQGIHIFRCKKAHILSDTLLPVHVDGENCSYLADLIVQLKIQKINVLSET